MRRVVDAPHRAVVRVSAGLVLVAALSLFSAVFLSLFFDSRSCRGRVALRCMSAGNADTNVAGREARAERHGTRASGRRRRGDGSGSGSGNR